MDTDILNDVIKGISPTQERYAEAIDGGAVFILSPMVHFEVTRYLKLIGATRTLRSYSEITTNWLPVNLEPVDWDTAADIWARRHRSGRPISDADLLIAVTALKTGAVLVTNNVSHFEGRGLTVENWALTEP